MTGSTVLLIVHQHAEEAGFLAVLRDYAVSAPHYNLDDLSKLDDRLEAHLDGLRIAAPSGLETLLMRLGPHAIGEVFASTVLAFESANAQVLSRLSEHLRGAVETERGYLMALGWLDWERVSPWIDRLLASPEPLFRRIGLAACGMHRHDPGPALLAGLSHADPGVLARAARTAGELRRRDLMPAIRAHRQHQEAAPRFWANWATAQMGDEEALEPLRQFAERPGEFQYRALCVLLAWQKRERSIAWIRLLMQNPEQRRIGIQAVGLLGDPVSVPWLIQQMSDLPHACVAGEAFSLMTGADLALLDLELQDLPDFDAGPNDDSEDSNVVMDPDENLPWPDPPLIAAWWQAHGGDFQAGVGYVLGLQQSESSYRQALIRGQQHQRIAAACGIARLRPSEVLFPTSAPAWRQKALLGEPAGFGR
ncbi:TIGR02270 family protein [Pseudomonas chlororaphis]|uniref:TIGR02270 family protein n=1 Tax=Pseudomonas chlororaphis TaxID=587753 RepID=UPI0023689286|nr:TIGR02270 family protein [Pseudomonas chlororaphis]WDG77704.1 TIGR02270 family protein [Pseudomonas chlororaphis]WDG83059.1 TIGR02270 family protein [Pseudomonas chlororaphis]